MKIPYRCTITLEDDGKYLVTFPDFPEALTEGDTHEEALFNASEVLSLVLEARRKEGREIPLPVQC